MEGTMTDGEAILFVREVIAGTKTLSSQEMKNLSADPNPEWFCSYSSVRVKMHTGAKRETISGVKLVDTDGERSFFNLGAVLALKTGGVGPRKAVDEYRWCFADWTAGLTWDEAREFLKTILANSLEKTPNLKK